MVDPIDKKPNRDDLAHPMQPIGWDGNGVIRFKANAIVDALVEECRKLGGTDLNRIAFMVARGEFRNEDQIQLAQLIGYSVSGFGDLSYVPKSVVSEADVQADKAIVGIAPDTIESLRARAEAAEAELERLRTTPEEALIEDAAEHLRSTGRLFFYDGLLAFHGPLAGVMRTVLAAVTPAIRAPAVAQERERCASLERSVYMTMITGNHHCPCGNGRVPTGAYEDAGAAFAAAIRGEAPGA